MYMETIHVHGGVRLQGNVRIHGSKNAALPILAATILTQGDNLICNCPKIADVCQMLKILTALGCKVSREGDGIRVDAKDVALSEMPVEAVTCMRSSLFLMGALLGRRGEVMMEYPGGCVIGARPIDFHLEALKKMGAVFEEKDGKVWGRAPEGLHGADICFQTSSVGATENIILAAVTAEGITRLWGAAREPEVEHLCRYLKKCGARIEGIGTECLTITGGKCLYGTQYRVPADRIVAGTYLIACLGTGGNVLLEEAPVEHMEAVIRLGRLLGAECQMNNGALYVQAPDQLGTLDQLITLPHPGFPTDLQSAALVMLTAAGGECLVHETIFENRFRVIEPLERMGADICQLDSRSVKVRGPVKLRGAQVEAMELRGGAALVIAGLMAEGETKVCGCGYISRGYENICRDFRELGARIYSA